MVGGCMIAGMKSFMPAYLWNVIVLIYCVLFLSFDFFKLFFECVEA